MPAPESLLDESDTIPTWAKKRGRSTAWGYVQVNAGLPTFELNGRKYIHNPTANKWLADRMRSRGRKVAVVTA